MFSHNNKVKKLLIDAGEFFEEFVAGFLFGCFVFALVDAFGELRFKESVHKCVERRFRGFHLSQYFKAVSFGGHHIFESVQLSDNVIDKLLIVLHACLKCL